MFWGGEGPLRALTRPPPTPGGVRSRERCTHPRWLLRKLHPRKPRDAFPALDPEPSPLQLLIHTPLQTGDRQVPGAWTRPLTGAKDRLLKRTPSWEGACPAEVPSGRVEGDVGLVMVRVCSNSRES